MNRLPQSWAGLLVWLMLATSAGWVAYILSSSYVRCRASDLGQVTCLFVASTAAFYNVVIEVLTTLERLARLLLP